MTLKNIADAVAGGKDNLTSVEKVCKAAGEKAPNVDSENGIHYGVIHQNKLGEGGMDDIMNRGDDIDFDDALAEVKEIITSAIESALSAYHDSFTDAVKEAACDAADEEFGQTYESGGDCTRYRYEQDGYILQVASDGDIFVIKSPYYVYANPCSPCAPNAGYLDGEEATGNSQGGGIKTYCLGFEWFDDGDEDYQRKSPHGYVYRVDGDEIVKP